MAGKRKTQNLGFFIDAVGFLATFLRPPAMIGFGVGWVMTRGWRWFERDRWGDRRWPDGGVPATQSEAEREGATGERERESGPRREKRFPK